MDSRVEKSGAERKVQCRKGRNELRRMLSNQFGVGQCASDDASGVERMKPFSHVLQNQNSCFVFDAWDVSAKASIDRAVATVASLVLHQDRSK